MCIRDRCKATLYRLYVDGLSFVSTCKAWHGSHMHGSSSSFNVCNNDVSPNLMSTASADLQNCVPQSHTYEHCATDAYNQPQWAVHL